MHYFGAHIDSYDNLNKAADRIHNSGGNLIQLFMFDPKNSQSFSKHLKTINMKSVIHSSYTHNIAKNWDQYSWWIKNIKNEIKYASDLDSFGIVLHVGKKLDLSQEQAINNMFSSLVFICTNTNTQKYKNIKIFIETSAGQGTELYSDIQDLGKFYQKIINHNLSNRIQICIDTCHIFSSGYDIRNKETAKKFLNDIDKHIGLKNIGLIHLNDSKVDIGRRIDRHANINDGYIGIEGLKYIFDFFKKKNVPIVLETPNQGYIDEINLLKNKIKL